jgi:hypothetical protein
MNFRYLILLCILCNLTVSFGQSGKFIVSNQSGVSRKEDPMVIGRDALSGFMDLPTEKKVPVVTVAGKEVPSQLDDLNGDGIWDELVFQIDIERNSKEEVKVKWVSQDKSPFYPRRTQARLGVFDRRGGQFLPVTKEFRPENWTAQQQPARYQLEGPCWENDKVAFRNFFDSRNTNEVLGKISNYLILDTLGQKETNILSMRPWGMNILQAGPSLGLGGIALIHNGLPVPLRNTTSAFYREVAVGPVRSVIELIYEGWQVENQNFNVKERISIWAGKYWFKAEVVITGFTGDKEIAVGISNLKNSSPAIYQTNNTGFSSLAGHARQSENADMLGIGLLFANSGFNGYGEAPRHLVIPGSDTLSHSYYGKLKIRSGQPVEFLSFAAWEKTDPKFANSRYFLDLIQEEADRKDNPLQISKK